MIGVYDSGVGGLTVLRELKRLMPEEDYVYYSDGANCPYGPKDPEFLRQRAKYITDLLIARGAEIVVVACNTATAAAISYLRKNYDIPFIGMEPAIKPAALQSHTGVVGVLATAGTFKGRLYLDTLAKFAEDVKVIEKVGTGLVEAVELGDFSSPALMNLLRGYIEPMIAEGADHIVLGCTHYPFLENAIHSIAGPAVTIVNPAPAVARQTKHILEQLRNGSSAPAECRQETPQRAEALLLGPQASKCLLYTPRDLGTVRGGTACGGVRSVARTVSADTPQGLKSQGYKKVEPSTGKGSTEYLSSGNTEVLLRLSSIR